MPDDRPSRPHKDALRRAGLAIGGTVVVAVALGLIVGGKHGGCVAGPSGVEPAAAALDLAPKWGGVAAPRAPQPPTQECLQCAIEDRRREAHKQQVEVTARYLGLETRWLDGQRTKLGCTRDREVLGVVRFALVGHETWLAWWGDRRQRGNLKLALPCPELSRPAYAELYRYDPDDTERDGLGHAPVLQRGKVYRLKLVADPDGLSDEPIQLRDGERVMALVAADPS